MDGTPFSGSFSLNRSELSNMSLGSSPTTTSVAMDPMAVWALYNQERREKVAIEDQLSKMSQRCQSLEVQVCSLSLWARGGECAVRVLL
jgi:hypothetical protein